MSTHTVKFLSNLNVYIINIKQKRAKIYCPIIARREKAIRLVIVEIVIVKFIAFFSPNGEKFIVND
jgi:hypothetical protein